MSFRISSRSSRTWLRVALIAALGSSPLWALHALADDQDSKKAEGKAKTITVVVNDEGESYVSEVRVDDEREQVPRYWLGVMLKDVQGDLATYLGETEGVLIETVFPDSPAAESGLKKGDIVIKFDGEELSDAMTVMTKMRDLANKAGDAAEEAPVVKMLVLRKGEEVEVEVKVTERPADMQATAQATAEFSVEASDDAIDAAAYELEKALSWTGENPSAEIQSMLEKLNDGLVAEEMKILRMGDPAMLFVPEGGMSSFDNMEMVVKKDVDGKKLQVTVSRKDGKPAEITVEEDGETTKYTEEDLEEMPEEVREVVEQALSTSGKGKLRIGTGALQLKIDPERAKAMAEQAKVLVESRAKEWKERAATLAQEAGAQAEEIKRSAEAQAAKAKLRAENQSGEVKELRKLVEDLKSQVEALQKQLQEKNDQ